MAFIIPVNSDGNREVLVNTPEGDYRFRAYYTEGQDPGWLLDINDPEGNPILVGRRLTAGAPNIVKGFGDALRDVQITVSVIAGMERDFDGLGYTTFPVWFEAGEDNPAAVGDPMIDIPADLWAFKDLPDGR